MSELACVCDTQRYILMSLTSDSPSDRYTSIPCAPSTWGLQHNYKSPSPQRRRREATTLQHDLFKRFEVQGMLKLARMIPR